MQERSDQDWIRLIKNGDPQAIEDLCLVLMQYAKTAVRYRCGDLDQVTQDQLAQDAAVQAWRRIASRGVYQFQYRCSFRGYCKKIIANEVLRALHPILRQPTSVDEEVLERVAAEPQPDERAIMERLRPCLELLSRREREAFELYAQQFEPEEAAQRLNISRNNYNVIAHRCRRKLRHCLEKHGYHTAGDLM
jgi:RNA polymerase sigma factor (sigma-70 family)